MDEQPSFWKKCKRVFTDYIGCNLLDAVIVGALNALFLYVMKMPHIAVISVAAGLTNMIPTFGPVLGTLVGCVLLVLDKPINALWFLVFTVLLQLLDGYLIKPKLFGSKLGVPSLGVVAATLIGGHLFGIVGILLAVPVAAVLLMALRELTRRREKKELLTGDADEAPDEKEE